jgi:hypothetical protein
VTLYTNLRSLTMLAASDAKHVSNAGAAGCSEDGGADRQLAAVPEHRQLVYVAPGGGRGQAHAQEACQAACESCCRCDAMSSTSLQSGTSLQRCYTYLISWYNFRASTLRRFFKCNSCDEYDVPIEWERQLNSQSWKRLFGEISWSSGSRVLLRQHGLPSCQHLDLRLRRTSTSTVNQLRLAAASSDRRFRPRSARRFVPARLQTVEGQCRAMTSSLVTRCGSAPQ